MSATENRRAINNKRVVTYGQQRMAGKDDLRKKLTSVPQSSRKCLLTFLAHLIELAQTNIPEFLNVDSHSLDKIFQSDHTLFAYVFKLLCIMALCWQWKLN